MSVSTSATPYATTADLWVHSDWRTVADWVANDDNRPSSIHAMNDPTTVVGGIVYKHLLRASGEVELSCQTGGRYSPADLASLTGATKEALVALVCTIALWRMAARRQPLAEVPAQMVMAHETLSALRKGELVFGVVANIESAAGLDAIEFSSQLNNPSRTVNQASRFFGHRGRT